MIVTFDLSKPRKLLQDISNELSTYEDISKIPLNKFSSIALFSFVFLLSEGSNVIAEEVNNLTKTEVLFKNLHHLYEIAGIPTVYTICELFKMKEPIANYIRFKSLEINTILKKLK